MKEVLTTLLAELKTEINTIPEKRNSLPWLEKARTIALTKLENLKEKTQKHTFKSEAEEIDFFKNQKPILLAKVIELEQKHKIERRKVPGTLKEQKKYYQREIKKINRYFQKNSKNYQVIRSQKADVNKKYFLRNRENSTSFSSQMDATFTTQLDFEVANFTAMKRIKNQLLNKIEKKKTKKEKEDKSKLQWTGSKVALVELIYALNAAGVVNNGKASLNETCQLMQTMFNTELGQFNRIYLEIKARKTERTKFLNTLQTNLITRMNQADEK
ncbi:RteC domain-containing protein [Flavobacterium lacus]|uniref:RteC protein n=1 Tax=Flavobacterium lacus TaxID=1353778 RepID=A0A328WRJ5_9FLAO|nr:RteC domain-containing protein [Flavobacterium lacus]RAR46464.1 RteC protein [Flavobacterium lacus]